MVHSLPIICNQSFIENEIKQWCPCFSMFLLKLSVGFYVYCSYLWNTIWDFFCGCTVLSNWNVSLENECEAMRVCILFCIRIRPNLNSESLLLKYKLHANLPFILANSMSLHIARSLLQFVKLLFCGSVLLLLEVSRSI